MTTKQELRLWGIILVTGAAVSTTVMVTQVWLQAITILLLYVSGLFISSDYALRTALKSEKKEQDKQAAQANGPK